MFNVVFIWKTIPESRAYGKAHQTSGVTLTCPIARSKIRLSAPPRSNVGWQNQIPEIDPTHLNASTRCLSQCLDLSHRSSQIHARRIRPKQSIKRQVSLTAQATLGGAAAQSLLNAQLRKVELQLQALVQNLNQTFVFDPVPIQVKTCDRRQPFERAGSLTLCLQYARQLIQTFQDKTQASDALVYSMFQEMDQFFQSQWGLESSEPSTVLDELTTVLMLTFRLDATVDQSPDVDRLARRHVQ